MPDATVQSLLQAVGNFTLGIVLLYAWIQERKERIDAQARYEMQRDKAESDHQAERRQMWSETLDYLRDQNGIPRKAIQLPPDISKIA